MILYEMDGQKLLTKKEVQDYLRVSHETLQKYMRDLGLPYIKLGHRVLFEHKALAAWLDARTVISGDTKAPRRSRLKVAHRRPSA